jgi:dinuclear metal center YbgI/SA1388 family protein
MCCPDGAREVKRVLVALDATDAVCQAAIDGGYDMILTHHPFIFKGLRAFEDENAIALKAMKLVREGISVMSFHTRLDALAGGVNDALANSLGLENVETFEGEGLPLCRVGELSSAMSLHSFAALVKEALGAPFVSFSDAGREVKRVAVVGGGGEDFIAAARAVGADTYVSGEFGHHALTDEPDAARGINLIEAGHFYTEQPVCKALCGMITEIDSAIECDIINSNPIKTV